MGDVIFAGDRGPWWNAMGLHDIVKCGSCEGTFLDTDDIVAAVLPGHPRGWVLFLHHQCAVGLEDKLTLALESVREHRALRRMRDIGETS